jgi:hypothetical protein
MQETCGGSCIFTLHTARVLNPGGQSDALTFNPHRSVCACNAYRNENNLSGCDISLIVD